MHKGSVIIDYNSIVVLNQKLSILRHSSRKIGTIVEPFSVQSFKTFYAHKLRLKSSQNIGNFLVIIGKSDHVSIRKRHFSSKCSRTKPLLFTQHDFKLASMFILSSVTRKITKCL